MSTSNGRTEKKVDREKNIANKAADRSFVILIT